MSVIRYPALTRDLTFTSDDEVFLDTSFILTSMLASQVFNKFYSSVNQLMSTLKTQNVKLSISPTVYSEVVDGLVSLFLANDWILYLQGEKDKSKYTAYATAKQCFETTKPRSLISAQDMASLEAGRYSDVVFKGYLTKLYESDRRTWVKPYAEPANLTIDRFIWAYQIRVVSSVDALHNRIVPLTPYMDKMCLRSNDALHLGTATINGCTYFFTVDTDFKSNKFGDLITVLLVTDKRQ